MSAAVEQLVSNERKQKALLEAAQREANQLVLAVRVGTAEDLAEIDTEKIPALAGSLFARKWQMRNLRAEHAQLQAVVGS